MGSPEFVAVVDEVSSHFNITEHKTVHPEKKCMVIVKPLVVIITSMLIGSAQAEKPDDVTC